MGREKEREIGSGCRTASTSEETTRRERLRLSHLSAAARGNCASVLHWLRPSSSWRNTALSSPGVIMASIFRPVLAGCNLVLEHSNVTVTALTAAAILYTRSAGIAYFALGAVVCSRTVKAVKRFIRQPRPVHPSPERQKKSYGMPSTHAAVITYYAAYTLLASAYLPIHPVIPDTPWTRIVVPSVVVPWSIAIAVSRIWLGHHTVPQVLAGCVHGVIFTYMWYTIWLHGANDYGRYLEQTYFARP